MKTTAILAEQLLATPCPALSKPITEVSNIVTNAPAQNGDSTQPSFAVLAAIQVERARCVGIAERHKRPMTDEYSAGYNAACLATADAMRKG